MRLLSTLTAASLTPTPYRVACDCVDEGVVYLLREDYHAQVVNASADFRCPNCGRVATFDWDWNTQRSIEEFEEEMKRGAAEVEAGHIREAGEHIRDIREEEVGDWWGEGWD